MRVLVCGGRDYGDKAALYAKLDALHAARAITCIISGMAAGADSLAISWASKHSIAYVLFRADWKKFGRLAGPTRNKQMLVEGKPDLVVAFQGGRGTVDMVERTRKANVELITVE